MTVKGLTHLKCDHLVPSLMNLMAFCFLLTLKVSRWLFQMLRRERLTGKER